MSRIAFVTGATGAVGPALVRQLAAGGWQVRALVRPTSAAADLPHGVVAVRGDLDDTRALRDGMRDAHLVVHLAALLHVVAPTREMHAAYERVNVEGTRHVVDAARAAGVARVVAASTIAVYGPSAGVLTETTVPEPDTIYGQTKLAAERIVLDATTADGRPIGVVLRLSAVYGGGLKGNYLRLVRAIARRRFVALGDGSNHRALVFDEDAARVVVAAADEATAGGRVINVSDGQQHSMRAIVTSIRAATGRRGYGPALPLGPIRLGVSMVERLGTLARVRLPISRAALGKYVEDVRVDSTRLQDVLGPLSMTPMDEGWRATVEGLRARGQL